MRGRRSAAMLMVGALVLLAACERSPVASPGASVFTATVEGSVVSSYQGTGHFTFTGLRRPAAPAMFILHSSGIGEAQGQGFELYHPGRALVDVGSYTIGADGGPFTAVYTRTNGSQVERFAARSGEIQVTGSTSTRVAGTFRFSAVLSAVCSYRGSAVSCTTRAADQDAPAVEVSGSFQAVPSAAR